MAVWAIGDLHLSFGIPNKTMDIFGLRWKNHADRIKQAWQASVALDDLVLIPGDICWATKLQEAIINLLWIHELPGTKLFIKGNHDYWWPDSLAKLYASAPPSCHFIQNNSFFWQDISIAGTRLWDIPGLNFDEVIDIRTQRGATTEQDAKSLAENAKIYQRELGRLELSLKSMNPTAQKKVVMTHYPPIGLHFQETEVSHLLEKFGVHICVFGHLHQIKPDLRLFGEHNGINYHLVACDYLEGFRPLKII